MYYCKKDKIINLYESRYTELGYNIKTVGWGTVQSQHLRFKILAGIADLSDSSICDIGCGFGDLYPYLIQRFSNIEYTGFDLCCKLINEAKKRYPDARFEQFDILEKNLNEKFDYIFCSGALNCKIDNHEKYIWEMLKSMHNLCKHGLAVNFLSTYVDYQIEKDFHFEPEKAISMARQFSNWVTLRHDYPLYEFTVYIYRKPLEVIGGHPGLLTE